MKLCQLPEWAVAEMPGYERLYVFSDGGLWLEGDTWFCETRGTGGIRAKERVPEHAVREHFRARGRFVDATP